jgi:hypothetical protein
MRSQVRRSQLINHSQARHRRIMMHHDLAVTGGVHIEFDAIGMHGNRATKRVECVPHRVSGSAAVGQHAG